jgi:hypothetical protein
VRSLEHRNSILNKERLFQELGRAFFFAYEGDIAFCREVAHLVQAVQLKAPKQELFWFQDSVNMWLMSSFHQARVAEHLFESASQSEADSATRDLLIKIQHDTADGIVHPLVNCLNLLKKCKYASVLGASPEEIQAAFDVHFPDLVDVRNALAHEEDRVMPPHHLSSPTGALAVLTIQSKAQAGNHIWGLKTRDRAKDLAISFGEDKYFGLVRQLFALFSC